MPVPVPQEEQEGARATNANLFDAVLHRGPTEIPPDEDVSAALTAILPPVEAAGAGAGGGGGGGGGPSRRRRRQEEGRRPLSSSASASDCDEQAGRGADHNDGGVVGWAIHMGLSALMWAGQTVHKRAVVPVVKTASPLTMFWANYMFQGVASLTPQRAKDLARILSNALCNTVSLWWNTEAGVDARTATAWAVDRVAATASAPAGRRLVIDGAAGLVKLAEALDTPEAKDAIQQGAVVASQFFQLLASEECRDALQSVADAIVKVIELANSPEATVMAAELTANVVHALEMEAQQHDAPLSPGGSAGAELYAEEGGDDGDCEATIRSKFTVPSSSLERRASLSSSVMKVQLVPCGSSVCPGADDEAWSQSELDSAAPDLIVPKSTPCGKGKTRRAPSSSPTKAEVDGGGELHQIRPSDAIQEDGVSPLRHYSRRRKDRMRAPKCLPTPLVGGPADTVAHSVGTRQVAECLLVLALLAWTLLGLIGFIGLVRPSSGMVSSEL
jgi:hypothetical protein